MLRIVVDTNIYISALNFGGVPDQVLALARRGRVDLFICRPIFGEIEGVLKKKFHWPAGRIREALRDIREFATTVELSERVTIVEKDEPDNRVLECALGRERERHRQRRFPPSRIEFLSRDMDPNCASLP